MKRLFIMLAMLVSIPTYAFPSDSSILVLDVFSNKPQYVHNGEEIRPIASITKLMTAMVTLDYDKDLGRKLLLSGRVPSSIPRQYYTRLLNVMLVRSDNAAAETIAEDYPGGRSEFVKQMNLHAKVWRMNNTAFIDPTGLSVFNVSTVYDVANMVQTASGYWFIKEASVKKTVSIETQVKKKSQIVNLTNTNQPLLFEFNNIVISKTGLTNAAGWCMSLFVTQKDKDYVIVVLGSKNKNERTATVKDIMYSHVLDASS
jgi:serine-type D-Ala-D-Ala endopeptidase (penicillin-binding protein 7)